MSSSNEIFFSSHAFMTGAAQREGRGAVERATTLKEEERTMASEATV